MEVDETTVVGFNLCEALLEGTGLRVEHDTSQRVGCVGKFVVGATIALLNDTRPNVGNVGIGELASLFIDGTCTLAVDHTW